MTMTKAYILPPIRADTANQKQRNKNSKRNGNTFLYGGEE